MKKVRDTIDAGFKQFGYGIIRFKWMVLLLMILLTGVMASQLRNIKFDTSTEGFFHEQDPAVLNYNEFREQFGRDEMVVIMLKPKQVFDIGFLSKLRDLHEQLEEEVPSVKDVTSLVNARFTQGAEGELIVEDLLENFPESQEDLDVLRQKVLNHHLYKNLLISEDGTYTTMTIKTDAYTSLDANGQPQESEDIDDFSEIEIQSDAPRALLTDAENSAIVKKVLEITEQYRSEDLEIRVAGSPVVTEFLKKTMQRDMRKFTMIAIGVIGLFLFVLFRRLAGTLLPLATVILSVIFTFGLMSVTGTAIKTPTMILPSFLLAVGIGAAVHMMAIFYKDYVTHNKYEAIVGTLEHSGLPIAMTSLTTAAGLASFSTAEIAPIADLGFFSAMGVLFSMMMTLVFIPALLAILPLKPVIPEGKKEHQVWLDKVLLSFGHVATTHPARVVATAAVIVVIAILGTMKLQFAHNILEWFPQSSSIYQNTSLIDDKMRGSVTLEMIIDTGKENGLYQPENMEGLKELSEYALQHKGEVTVGKTISLVDMIQEIHQALNENKPEYFAIPQDDQLIAQEFLLFENSGSDDLEDLVDSRFSKARLTVKLPWGESNIYTRFIADIQEKAQEIFSDRAKVTVTGMIVLFSQTTAAMMNSTVVSYSIAFGVITFMMILLLGDIKIGLISMIPNVTPILITLGFMGWMGIPLDMFTLLIGSIAIGLAVDDTIHFFHNFRRYYEKSGVPRIAVDETLLSTGRAMLVTTLVLTTGFWLFMLATLNNLFNFGLLTGLTLVIAFLGDVLLAPALLTLVKGKTEVSEEISSLKQVREA